MKFYTFVLVLLLGVFLLRRFLPIPIIRNKKMSQFLLYSSIVFILIGIILFLYFVINKYDVKFIDISLSMFLFGIVIIGLVAEQAPPGDFD